MILKSLCEGRYCALLLPKKNPNPSPPTAPIKGPAPTIVPPTAPIAPPVTTLSPNVFYPS